MRRFRDSIEIEVTAMPDDTPIRGNAIASGDPEYDKKVEDSIIEELENGNQWAWCTVKVTARIPGIDLEGTDYLGSCSYYKGESEFTEPGGYYEDMVARATEDLLEKIKAIKELE